MALNTWVNPTGMLGKAGVTAMEERAAEFTVRFVFPEMLPKAA